MLMSLDFAPNSGKPLQDFRGKNAVVKFTFWKNSNTRKDGLGWMDKDPKLTT